MNIERAGRAIESSATIIKLQAKIRQLNQEIKDFADYRALKRQQIKRLYLKIENLELAAKEARKTIDRLNALIPRSADAIGPLHRRLYDASGTRNCYLMGCNCTVCQAARAAGKPSDREYRANG